MHVDEISSVICAETVSSNMSVTWYSTTRDMAIDSYTNQSTILTTEPKIHILDNYVCGYAANNLL